MEKLKNCTDKLFKDGRQQQTNLENIKEESDSDIIKDELIYAL